MSGRKDFNFREFKMASSPLYIPPAIPIQAQRAYEGSAKGAADALKKLDLHISPPVAQGLGVIGAEVSKGVFSAALRCEGALPVYLQCVVTSATIDGIIGIPSAIEAYDRNKAYIEKQAAAAAKASGAISAAKPAVELRYGIGGEPVGVPAAAPLYPPLKGGALIPVPTIDLLSLSPLIPPPSPVGYTILRALPKVNFCYTSEKYCISAVKASDPSSYHNLLVYRVAYFSQLDKYSSFLISGDNSLYLLHKIHIQDAIFYVQRHHVHKIEYRVGIDLYKIKGEQRGINMSGCLKDKQDMVKDESRSLFSPSTLKGYKVVEALKVSSEWELETFGRDYQIALHKLEEIGLHGDIASDAS